MYKTKLIIHLKRHLNIKSFHCPICSKNFSEKGNMKIHVRTHTNERPYPCEFCPKKFKTFGQLKDHRATHSGLRPFLCEKCGKKFGRKSVLFVHLGTHGINSKSRRGKDKATFKEKCGGFGASEDKGEGEEILEMLRKQSTYDESCSSKGEKVGYLDEAGEGEKKEEVIGGINKAIDKETDENIYQNETELSVNNNNNTYNLLHNFSLNFDNNNYYNDLTQFKYKHDENSTDNFNVNFDDFVE